MALTEMHKIAEKRRRFGYRRVGIMLERKGMIMNEKKLYRIYREEGLSVRRRRGRKHAPLRANKRETTDWLKFTLEGAGERTHGYAFTDTTFAGCWI